MVSKIGNESTTRGNYGETKPLYLKAMKNVRLPVEE